MIKLRRFIDDPIGAYESYKKEFEHKYGSLFNENANLKRDIASLRSKIRTLRHRLREAKKESSEDTARLYIRTLHWYYTGEKMEKGTEFEFVEKIREETKERT